MLVLDERHQVHVVLASDDEDPLAGVSRVRVLQDVEQVATLDVEDDFLEPDVAIRLELRVLRVVPGEGTSPPISVAQRVPTRHTLASAPCAHQCAQTRSKNIILKPTPTNVPIKNGPEIVNFRPVLGFPVALANRRLQPLGHLTARES